MINQENIFSTIVKLLTTDNRLSTKGIRTNSVRVAPFNRDNGYDLLWNFNFEGNVYNYAIITKFTNSPIGLIVIRQAQAITESLEKKIDGIIIASTSSPTEEAFDYIKTLPNLFLIQVVPTTKDDWQDRIREINIHLNISSPRITNVALNVNKDSGRLALEKSGKSSFSLNYVARPEDIEFFDSSQKKIGNIGEILTDYISKAQTDEAKERSEKRIEHKFTTEVFIKTEIGNILLDGFSFDLIIDHIVRPITINAESDLGFQTGFSIVRFVTQKNSFPKAANNHLF